MYKHPSIDHELDENRAKNGLFLTKDKKKARYIGGPESLIVGLIWAFYIGSLQLSSHLTCLEIFPCPPLYDAE